MNRSLPDKQVQRVYVAEVALDPWNYKIQDHDEIVEYCNNLLDNARVKAEYGKWYAEREIDVAVRRTNAVYSLANVDGIWITPCDFTVCTVIHEIAHVLQYRIHERHAVAGHDWTFTSIYLSLVRAMLGKGAHAALQSSFDFHKVEYRPRPLTRYKK